MAASQIRNVTLSRAFASAPIMSTSKNMVRPSFLLQRHEFCALIPNRNFKSDIHTDELYPGSKITDRFGAVDLSTLGSSSKSPFDGIIPVKDITITYTGSSAPGGQNVNKIATKVDARFKLETANWLSDEMKGILREKWKGQLTKEGYFVVKSERTRSQLLNQVFLVFFSRGGHAVTSTHPAFFYSTCVFQFCRLM